MLNPYVPRPIDRPATVPLDPSADLSVLDEAKIFAAPDDPADWPAWRAALTRWRDGARAGYDGSRYDAERTDGFVVALAWLWDELPDVVAAFQAAGVRVFVSYHPWEESSPASVAGEAGLLERGAPAVWNLTESEHTDGRTRFLILKGASAFVPTWSDWYFDGGERAPSFSAKYLLMGAGLDRSPSIGFRCAVGLPGVTA